MRLLNYDYIQSDNIKGISLLRVRCYVVKQFYNVCWNIFIARSLVTHAIWDYNIKKTELKKEKIFCFYEHQWKKPFPQVLKYSFVITNALSYIECLRVSLIKWKSMDRDKVFLDSNLGLEFQNKQLVYVCFYLSVSTQGLFESFFLQHLTQFRSLLSSSSLQLIF